tara:strand:+ start:16205 stop:16462 length:258 start_codon:yes stop_codon:yes gene_type:complete
MGTEREVRTEFTDNELCDFLNKFKNDYFVLSESKFREIPREYKDVFTHCVGEEYLVLFIAWNIKSTNLTDKGESKLRELTINKII